MQKGGFFIKAVLLTPMYLSISWILMISYQLFTQTAVTTVVAYVSILQPSSSAWLSTRVDIIVFVYAFSWIFVLSSVIPSAILGRERSVLAQFLVCMVLTFLAFSFQDVMATLVGVDVDQLFSMAVFLKDPFLAAGYLFIPYALMLVLDLRSSSRSKKDGELRKVISVLREL